MVHKQNCHQHHGLDDIQLLSFTSFSDRLCSEFSPTADYACHGLLLASVPARHVYLSECCTSDEVAVQLLGHSISSDISYP